jgi:hypothetical protein
MRFTRWIIPIAAAPSIVSLAGAIPASAGSSARDRDQLVSMQPRASDSTTQM